MAVTCKGYSVATPLDAGFSREPSSAALRKGVFINSHVSPWVPQLLRFPSPGSAAHGGSSSRRARLALWRCLGWPRQKLPWVMEPPRCSEG